ncbi:MAG TPA: tol-pal system-associated acyl-CoA thioesterase [Paenalcaligenes sp.]|nr:tol-pal system-associated acyl-CoA thioesterase [Paenalcaligenes sp.]
METSLTTHQLPIRIYYEDTDAGGIVYYANYMKYFERARTEWLRTLGISQSRLAQEQKQLFVVRQSEVHYLQPAQLDDLLTVETTLVELRGASLTFSQQAVLDGTPMCSSTTVVVCINSETMRPTKIHPTIRTILEKVRV